MPTYEVTGPDGTVIEVDGDTQPTEDELRRIFRHAKDYMQDQAVAGMDGEKLLAYAKENPGVELSDKAYRKIFDYQEGKKTDWSKEVVDFAKAVPGAVFSGIGSMVSGAFRAVTEDVPSLLGEATVDPALAAKKAAITVGEFGQRQAAEIEMLPPAYLAQRMILDSQIPSFDSWYSDRAKKSKGQLPYEAGTLERINPAAFGSLKDEYEGFKDSKRYQNWKSVFFKKQADAVKAAKVESGETSYIAEASGGKGVMEAAIGTSEIYPNAAQALTDFFGIDAIPPVVSTLGRKVATKIPGTDRLVTRAASKVAEKAGEALDTAGRIVEQGKDLMIIGAPLSAAGKTMEITADVNRAAAAVASGVGSEAALRQVRSKAARVALSPFNNNLVEKIVRNGAQALDELVPAGITGGLVGTVMAIGAESGEEAGQIVGGQIGSGMALGSGVAATVGARRIADFNKANTLLGRLTEEERRGLLARRIAMHQSSHGEMAGEVAIQEIADVARTQEALAIEGERIKLMTADEIAVFAAVIGEDPAKAASSQGFFATDPETGGRVMVVNTDRSVNLAKTARHEVLHSLKEAQSAPVPPSVLERMRQAYNDDTIDPATFRDETQKLYSDVFGVYDENGRQLEDGIVSQDDLDRMVRAYLARLHGDDTVAINQAMSVGERPMNSRELVDRFGDELFARIAEDFDLSSRKAGVVQSLLTGIAKKTGAATVFNAVSARLSLLRQALSRQGVNPLVDDLDRIAANPVIRGMVNEYLQMRKALQVELVREASSLAANVSVKNTLKGGEDVASRKRRTKRVNDLAAFGRLETNDAGEVLAQSGAVYSGELSDPPKVISQADASRRERSTSEAITKTLEGLGDQPDGMTLVDSDKPYWVGIPNEAQMAAIEGLPNSVVPERIKKALRIAINAARGEGNTLAFDYYKALTGGKYDARAEMRYNIVQPFSFRVSKAGNFLMQVFDIAKLNEKISGWKKRNPSYFDVWSTEEDPSGLSGLRNEIKAALERQRQGIKNNEGNTKGYKKILELLNIDSLDIDPASGGKRSMIQSRRIDRIGGEVQVGEPGWMIDYGRFKSPASFMPDPSQGSNIDMERLSELGFTEDIREAGYLTTDGKYIDLSGKREGGQPGSRSYDHREAGGTSGMMEFMAEGNIRLSPEGGMLDIMRQPTPSQESRLKEWMESFGGNVVVDLSDGLGKWDDRNNGYIPSERRTYMEFPDGTKPAKVLGMIRRFYSGEDIDSGIRFMPADERRMDNDKDVPDEYKQSRPGTKARMLGTGRIYSPAVAKMVSDEMKGKEINREELDRIIERDIPIRPVTPPKTKMDLPSVDEIKDALNEKQAVDAHADATEVFDVGDQVTLRQDVPSWSRAGVGVVTVRGSGGDVAYVPMVRVDNLMLYPTASEQASAARIASGAGKVPTIKATGTIAKTQALPTNLSRWQQVGFNPDRHSYYYLRSGDQKGRPVVAAQEAVQIGNTIFVRGQITYGEREDFRFMPADERRMDNDSGFDAGRLLEDNKLVRGLLDVAANDSSFRHGKVIDSKDISEIAEHYSNNKFDIGSYDFNDFIHLTKRDKDGKVAGSLYIRAKKLFRRSTGEYYLDSSEAESEGTVAGGGDQLYQTALTWIHNNGYRRIPDPKGVSPIAGKRTVSQLLSSALRHGTTSHIADPAVGRNNNTRLIAPWEPAELPTGMTIDDYRINLLAATEIRNVVDVYPEILDFQIDPETGSIEGYAEGKGRTRILRYKRDERVQSEPTQTGASADYVGGSEALGEGESWLAGYVAKARLRPGGDFIGETTLARTLVGLASSRGRELGNLFQRGQFDELGVSDIRPGGVQVGRPGLRVEPRSGGVSEDYVFYSPAEEQAPSRVKGDAAKRVKTSAINLLYSKQGDVAEDED